ncbi:MAG: gamma-glutamyl-phosphate reductase, partial [Oscillospiraceae bacterium]
MYDLVSLGKNAQAAARVLRVQSSAARDDALAAIAASLRANRRDLLDANRIDVETARQNGLREAMLDRLTLTGERIEGIARATEEIIVLPDPVGVVDHGMTRPNGLQILKTRVPIGVIGMIYEARPNVTVDAAALCLKSGNACILRGGREAFASNRALVGLMRRAVAAA